MVVCVPTAKRYDVVTILRRTVGSERKDFFIQNARYDYEEDQDQLLQIIGTTYKMPSINSYI